MITDKQLPELTIFKRIEKKLPFRVDFRYGSRVGPENNSDLPVHRWFRFKESFSADLLREILELIPYEFGRRVHLLDPFCGVATSLLASQELASSGIDIAAIGIERNPFVAFTASTKARWPKIDTTKLVKIGLDCEKQSRNSKPAIPPLSSLTSGRCISRYMSRRILAIADSIRREGASATHDAVLLGLASVIESVSYIRKDGRALRIVDKKKVKLPALLEAIWNTMAGDATLLQKCLPNPPIPKVVLGDGRRPLKYGVAPRSIDLVITSPPYPNNIDYTEVYKLELWLLGLVRSQNEFLSLRKSTFRSHPTCSPPEEVKKFSAAIRKGSLKSVLAPIIERAQDIKEPWRTRVLVGYFSDIWVSLEQQRRCLRKGGYSVIVVGNSLHGSAASPYLVPSDIVIAQIAERLGFKVHDIIISRPLKRRLSGNHFLRESIVILQNAT